MGKRVWLISARTMECARKIATGMGFSFHEWRYVPWYPEDVRGSALTGRRGYKGELIGWFSLHERLILEGLSNLGKP